MILCDLIGLLEIYLWCHTVKQCIHIRMSSKPHRLPLSRWTNQLTNDMWLSYEKYFSMNSELKCWPNVYRINERKINCTLVVFCHSRKHGQSMISCFLLCWSPLAFSHSICGTNTQEMEKKREQKNVFRKKEIKKHQQANSAYDIIFFDLNAVCVQVKTKGVIYQLTAYYMPFLARPCLSISCSHSRSICLCFSFSSSLSCFPIGFGVRFGPFVKPKYLDWWLMI